VKKNLKKFTIPTIYEVKEFFKSNGYDPEFGASRWHYYNDNDWHDSRGTKVLSWKQKMRAVWFKEEGKEKSSNQWKVKMGSDLVDTVTHPWDFYYDTDGIGEKMRESTSKVDGENGERDLDFGVGDGQKERESDLEKGKEKDRDKEKERERPKVFFY
jgi:hypothetical protein